MPRRLPQPSYDRSRPHEAILKLLSWPPSAPRIIWITEKPKQELLHLRKVRLSQNWTREQHCQNVEPANPWRPLRIIGGHEVLLNHVRFTPESRHLQCSRACLLWAQKRTYR